MVLLEEERSYSASEILALSKNEPKEVLKTFPNGDILVEVRTMVVGLGIEMESIWKIRCRPEDL